MPLASSFFDPPSTKEDGTGTVRLLRQVDRYRSSSVGSFPRPPLREPEGLNSPKVSAKREVLAESLGDDAERSISWLEVQVSLDVCKDVVESGLERLVCDLAIEEDISGRSRFCFSRAQRGSL
mmetsp:Transcript_66995/g.157173  ORF Transcript_66995/g.157173 Transcript_66995/m.157173 type:complete len:123 (-) Transcript_66995:188-556(-)